jgi:hypothetical protein
MAVRRGGAYTTPMNSNRLSLGRVLPPPTREQIAALAYAIWEDRGRPAGSDVDCWIEAERELQGEVASAHHTFVDDIPAELSAFERGPTEDPDIDAELDEIVSRPAPRSATAL